MDAEVTRLSELHPAVLQAAVTLGIAALCWYLYHRYRRPSFLWWSVAWSLYVFRILAIIAFLSGRNNGWLFIHQILTGWTALFLLWAAMSLAPATRWRNVYAWTVLFPLVWSYVAIYVLENFLLAAVPAVAFLSFATLWTAVVFLHRWRRTRSRGAAVLAAVLFTWGLHHLDYPILRAQGAWNPWGYYLDILFALAMGIGIVLLGLEELDRRAAALERLAAQMVRQHEDERRRVSMELHDQTAQVWAAVKLQLGLVRESAGPPLAARLDRVLELVDQGIRSIRNVTTNLRPPLLEDLGLALALRALVETFSAQTGLRIAFAAPPELPPLSPDASLAVFRALQEALSNIARHSGARSADVRLSVTNGELVMVVRDDGRGFPPGASENATTFGLAGMRERIAAVHGSVSLASDAGAAVTIRIPVRG